MAAKKTALVTGGARRIGKAVVEHLAASGFSVAIHANMSIDAAEALAEAIRADGGTAAVVHADLTDIEAVRGLVDAARGAIGEIGLLVNNASVFMPDTAEQFDEDTWNTHFAVHVRTPVMLAQAFAAQATGDDGLVVNMIDQRVWRLTPNFFSYTLSKSALWTATQTLAQGLAPRVRVNAIGPGPTLANERQSAEEFAAQAARVPLGHGPGLDEFGRTIRYLFDTPSITGQMIAIDGGQHLAWQTPDNTNIGE